MRNGRTMRSMRYLFLWRLEFLSALFNHINESLNCRFKCKWMKHSNRFGHVSQRIRICYNKLNQMDQFQWWIVVVWCFFFRFRMIWFSPLCFNIGVQLGIWFVYKVKWTRERERERYQVLPTNIRMCCKALWSFPLYRFRLGQSSNLRRMWFLC